MDTRREEYRDPVYDFALRVARVLKEMNSSSALFVMQQAYPDDIGDPSEHPSSRAILDNIITLAAGVQAERERTSGLVDAGKAMREEIREHMDFIDDRIPFRSERYMNEAAAKWDAAIAPPSTTPNDQER